MKKYAVTFIRYYEYLVDATENLEARKMAKEMFENDVENPKDVDFEEIIVEEIG